MDSLSVKLKVLNPALGDRVPLPEPMTAGAAGTDVRAVLNGADASLELAPGARALVPCGFAMAFPNGWECQVRPRSGLAAKKGVTVLNSPGTIDADYRGEVKVILINHGPEPVRIEDGERVAQLVFARVAQVAWEPADELDDTTRGDGGFGSTGRR